MTEEYSTDDEQLEVIKHAMTQHAPWLIGGALLGAALFFGYRFYGNYNNEQALQAAAQFNSMTEALRARVLELWKPLHENNVGSSSPRNHG